MKKHFKLGFANKLIFLLFFFEGCSKIDVNFIFNFK
ncbi:hypothetical protein JJE68_00397 [Pediococcus acidilactici]|nr:hypothetical protein JJE68_00397 [Pediococcus acidilactici]